MRRLLPALLALVGCAAPEAHHFLPLDSDGHHLRDELGRIAVLRGINARVDDVFDVSFDDGRTPLEEVPPLEASDCQRMRALGFDLLRLPINWSGVEPERGQYDEDYLDAVARAVDCAAGAGMLVLVDLHQDAYSKEIGEDGAPLWAIEPAPSELLEGPLDDLDQRRQSRQVNDAFASFFAAGDPHGLQAAYADMLGVVARRFADHPAVVGFELFNEPLATSDELAAFHVAAAAAVRAAAPDKLVFFEPSAVRNFLDSQPLAAAPFPVDGAVYAPHIYTYVFGGQDDALAGLDKDRLRTSIDNARAEADAWGVPLFLGEFGIGPEQTSADAWMTWQGELHDEYLASDAFWLWKEQSQGAWGVHDFDDPSWTERPQVVAWVSRLHPARIAARDARVERDGSTLAIEVDGAIDAPHLVYVPAEAATAVTATCDGAALTVDRDPATGLVALPCSGRLVVGD